MFTVLAASPPILAAIWKGGSTGSTPALAGGLGPHRGKAHRAGREPGPPVLEQIPDLQMGCVCEKKKKKVGCILESARSLLMYSHSMEVASNIASPEVPSTLNLGTGDERERAGHQLQTSTSFEAAQKLWPNPRPPPDTSFPSTPKLAKLGPGGCNFPTLPL